MQQQQRRQHESDYVANEEMLAAYLHDTSQKAPPKKNTNTEGRAEPHPSTPNQQDTTNAGSNSNSSGDSREGGGGEPGEDHGKFVVRLRYRGVSPERHMEREYIVDDLLLGYLQI